LVLHLLGKGRGHPYPILRLTIPNEDHVVPTSFQFRIPYFCNKYFLHIYLCQDLCSELKMRCRTDTGPTLMQSPSSQANVHRSHQTFQMPGPRVGHQNFQVIGYQVILMQVVYVCDTYIEWNSFGLKKEGNSDICYNMDVP